MRSVISSPHAAPAASVRRAAVLLGGCDGYAAGTTGIVHGHRDGCAVFSPDHPEAVARWATPRKALLVPAPLVLVTD